MIFNLEWNMLQKLIKFSIENKLTIGILTDGSPHHMGRVVAVTVAV